jgi:ankyrin repeat protein
LGNARDAVGRTALMYFYDDNTKITKLLIDAGADVNAKDNEAVKKPRRI